MHKFGEVKIKILWKNIWVIWTPTVDGQTDGSMDGQTDELAESSLPPLNFIKKKGEKWWDTPEVILSPIYNAHGSIVTFWK